MTYNTRKVIDIIISRYNLENNKTVRDNLRKKLERLCKTIYAVENDSISNLWDKSRVVIDGHKRPDHHFDSDEVKSIVNHPDMKKYIIGNISIESEELAKRLEEEVAEEEKYKKAAAQLNKRNAQINDEAVKQLLGEVPYDEAGAYFFADEDLAEELQLATLEDAHMEKLFIMVEALFLQHFTPIDEEQLRKDMNIYRYSFGSGEDFTPYYMRAIDRFEKRAYYKPLHNTKTDEH